MSVLQHPELLVIAGTTAAGKSELGQAAARVLGGEIISADSAAVYRGLDIGTGKPGAAERREVPHHCLDLCAPGEPFSVVQYREAAERAIAGVTAAGRLPLLVGGTGLYLRQVLDRPDLPPVPPDPALRAALGLRPPAGLHAELAVLDPAAAAAIHPADARRLIRALEVCRTTGRRVSEFWARSGGARRPCLLLVVDRPPGVLRARILERVDAMLARGLVDEVAGLLRAGVPPGAQALQALGYRQTVAWLAAGGHGPLREPIAEATARYAKRQRTWFRREPDAIWLDLGERPATDALGRVLALWSARTGSVHPGPAPA